MNLKRLRKENNFYQKDIAKKLNCTVSCISSWEKGITQPDINDLINLANIFNCSIDYLVGRESEDFKIITPCDTSENESCLLDAVRHLTLKNKKLLYSYSRFLLQEQKKVIYN